MNFSTPFVCVPSRQKTTIQVFRNLEHLYLTVCQTVPIKEYPNRYGYVQIDIPLRFLSRAKTFKGGIECVPLKE